MTNTITLKWTNQNQFKNHILALRKQFGDKIPIEAALDFCFELNNGLIRISK